MESDTAEPGRQAFEILELIDTLRDANLCQSSGCHTEHTDTLLDDLEDSYRFAMEPWAEHRVVTNELAQEDFYRWHEYMFPPDIYQDVRRRFEELVTTSRFSVESETSFFELQQVNSPSDKIAARHIASLAVLVCIHFALEELDPLEFLDAQKIEQARGLQRQADLWLEHLNTLNLGKSEFDLERKTEKIEKSKNAQRIAKLPRKKATRELTIELVASFFKERKNQKWEVVRGELAGLFDVGESTVSRIYAKAKQKNLLS